MTVRAARMLVLVVTGTLQGAYVAPTAGTRSAERGDVLSDPLSP